MTKAIYPFIPPVTQKKVVMVKGDLKKKREQLSEYIEPTQIEVDYGGDLTYTFDFDKYWGAEIKRYDTLIEQRQKQQTQP